MQARLKPYSGQDFGHPENLEQGKVIVVFRYHTCLLFSFLFGSMYVKAYFFLVRCTHTTLFFLFVAFKFFIPSY